MDYSNLCGLWISPEGMACMSRRAGDNEREELEEEFRPIAWVEQLPHEGEFKAEKLEGDAPVRHLLVFDTIEAYRELTRGRDRSFALDSVRPMENQFLLDREARFFDGLNFGELRRCQCDIETGCSVPGGFSSSNRPEDRVLAIGLSFSDEPKPVFLTLEEMSDAAERKLLDDFNAVIRRMDPDVIEGHNIFNFDLEYLRRRGMRLKVPCAWGRFGQNAVFRNSRLRVAERWIDFIRCDIPGRAVFDTLLAIQIFDLTTRALTSYSLKDVAIFLGVTGEGPGERTYLPGKEIQKAFIDDRRKFLAYLGDDLRETRGIAAILLPTYFAQAKNFPMTLQEVFLRGTAQKVELLLLEKYHHARRALPLGARVSTFEGGYTRSFETGVFKKIHHFDVASLYPSLLMHMERNPANDSLGIFIPLLRELRQYRLKYKELAQAADNKNLRIEYDARQASFKILINSFYGYLGFDGARFADSDLAAEVTRRGRELLQQLIAEFERLGCRLLEADTDGIYLATEEFWDNPEVLLEKVAHILPEGIELEHDGRYTAMFCYGAKNYALYDGKKITIRGSALRSRGIEPFLKKLTDHLIRFLLELESVPPLELASELRSEIETRAVDILQLAKSEYIGKSPENYQKLIDAGGKPRRASLEVALQIKPRPKQGERVSYYIQPAEKGKKSDWQRARSLDAYDPEHHPYDPAYYTKKIDAWIKRYSPFLDIDPEQEQKELF